MNRSLALFVIFSSGCVFPSEALPQDAGIVIKCSITVSTETSSADQASSRTAYRKVNLLLRFSDQLFQIYSDSLKAWSDNYCLSISPSDTDTSCILSQATMRAKWRENARQKLHNDQARWAEIISDVDNDYTIGLDQSGLISVQYYRASKLTSVDYYSIDANGRKKDMNTMVYRHGRMGYYGSDKYPDDWAGYNLRVTGSGSCVRVG